MAPQSNGHTTTELADWRHQTRVVLQPIAAPSILGLYGFAAATFMVAAHLAGWYGMWGAFWIAFGVLFLLVATGDLTVPAGKFVEFGFWFLTLAAITAAGAVASIAENLGLTAVLTTLAIGAGLLAVGYLTGGEGWLHTGGWVLIASSICAWYVATALMLKSSFGRVVLPLGEPRKAANVPGSRVTRPIEYEFGEPGVKQGQ